MNKLAIAAILGGTLLLAGCKQQHQEPPAENNAAEAPKPVAPPPPAPPPAPEKPKTATAPKPKPLPPTPEDQQVLDDADATGMTARVDRAGNNSDAQAATNHDQ